MAVIACRHLLAGSWYVPLRARSPPGVLPWGIPYAARTSSKAVDALLDKQIA